jgi:phage-related baseplate assembly protein
VTVVVVPYSTLIKPVPSEPFLRTVCRHLDRHRLITTRVFVTAPDYVSVGVQASVSLGAGFNAVEVRARAVAALNAFLRPLSADADKPGEGWPFGRTVFKSEVYEVIEGVEGVDCVERVTLTATGVGAGRDAQGNITILPQSLVYPGEHRVEVLFIEARCRRKQ